MKRLIKAASSNRSLGFAQAVSYLSNPNTSLYVNHRDGNGNLSAYVSNLTDGEGFAVRKDAIHKLEQYLDNEGWNRRQLSEYRFEWTKDHEIEASDDYSEDDYKSYDDYFYNTDIENDTIYNKGIYIDWSAVRGDSGPIWICYDPDHECDSDMWDYNIGEPLAKIDYSEYIEYIEDNILTQPEEEWGKLFGEYLDSFKN